MGHSGRQDTRTDELGLLLQYKVADLTAGSDPGDLLGHNLDLEVEQVVVSVDAPLRGTDTGCEGGPPVATVAVDSVQTPSGRIQHPL